MGFMGHAPSVNEGSILSVDRVVGCAPSVASPVWTAGVDRCLSQEACWDHPCHAYCEGTYITLSNTLIQRKWKQS